MKLRQLEYVVEVVRNNMSITSAADKLFTSQPGVSSQIKRLEEELGVLIFRRNGKNIDGLTKAGEMLIGRFDNVLQQIEGIENLAAEFKDPNKGTLSIATTHTQARYVLPPIITKFRDKYPQVNLNIHQGTPPQIAEMTATGKADIGIATEALELFDELVLLPCYRWNRCIMVPKGHPLAAEDLLTIEALADYPLITYVFGTADRSVINRAFKEANRKLNIVLTAADAEVIKTYVRSGLGVGLCARMAYDRRQDADIQVLDARHLFDSSITSLALRKQTQLRSYQYDFIEMFADHLDKSIVDEAMQASNKKLQDKLYDEHVKDAPMR